MERKLHVGKISIAIGGSGCASSAIFWCQLGFFFFFFFVSSLLCGGAMPHGTQYMQSEMRERRRD